MQHNDSSQPQPERKLRSQSRDASKVTGPAVLRALLHGEGTGEHSPQQAPQPASPSPRKIQRGVTEN